MSEYDRLSAQRDAIIERKEAPIREAIAHLEHCAELEKKLGLPCGEGNPAQHRRYASALYGILDPVSRRLLTLTGGHAPDCDWHCDQNPHECTCATRSQSERVSRLEEALKEIEADFRADARIKRIARDALNQGADDGR